MFQGDTITNLDSLATQLTEKFKGCNDHPTFTHGCHWCQAGFNLWSQMTEIERAAHGWTPEAWQRIWKRMVPNA